MLASASSVYTFLSMAITKGVASISGSVALEAHPGKTFLAMTWCATGLAFLLVVFQFFIDQSKNWLDIGAELLPSSGSTAAALKTGPFTKAEHSNVVKEQSDNIAEG